YDLEKLHLVQQHTPARYRMHDLVQLYAVERVRRDQSQSSITAALRRLIDFYVYTAHTGNQLLESQRPPLQLGRPAPGCVPHPLKDLPTALAWFDTGHPCLLAIQQLAVDHDWHARVWQLAWSLDTFYFRRGHLQHHPPAWRAGLAAAQRLDDPSIQIRAHRRLGRAYARTGRHPEALHHLRQALALAKQIGDVADQAHTHRALALAWERQGDH